MTTRIFFNGQEYASAEAMPAEVLKAYQEALGKLADADRNGIPDVLEQRGAGNVIGIQQSVITLNGKTYASVGEMPPLVRFLYEQAMGQLDPSRAGPSRAPDAPERSLPGVNSEPGAIPNERFTRVLDRSEKALSTVLVVILSAAAGAVIVFGSWMITHMDASSRSQGGVLYVGVAMVLLLGVIGGQLISAWSRARKHSGGRDGGSPSL
jgi:hypothetical protein